MSSADGLAPTPSSGPFALPLPPTEWQSEHFCSVYTAAPRAASAAAATPGVEARPATNAPARSNPEVLDIRYSPTLCEGSTRLLWNGWPAGRTRRTEVHDGRLALSGRPCRTVLPEVPQPEEHRIARVGPVQIPRVGQELLAARLGRRVERQSVHRALVPGPVVHAVVLVLPPETRA